MASKETIQPFVMMFQEKLPEEAISVVEGKYNDNLQVWEYSEELSRSFPVATFTAERPTTTCARPTRLSPTTTRVDTAADD